MLLDDFTSICLDLFNKYIFLSSPFFFFSIFHFLCPFFACANRPSVKCQVKGKLGWVFSSVSVAQSYPTLQPHVLQHTRLPCPSPAPELVQTHFHWVGDANSSSHLMLSLPLLRLPWIFPSIKSADDFPMSQLFDQVAKVFEFQLQNPMNIQDWFPLGWTGLTSLQSKWLSRVFSNTTAQKHQFFGAQLCLWSNSHIHTWLLEKPWLWLYGTLLAKLCLLFNMLSN